ncbi:hypothetical protein LMG23994_00976 [Cupriavidus pinatubonensis]|uniref:Uncharacterized protein n=1 Tax=Cupriavidus pinatubonensis TaxID=248026 RepID=A0ABM8WGE2_9BURK|nr:hypothetical protein LMG23994_00976 [Cupriavidus pinatubonensis]
MRVFIADHNHAGWVRGGRRTAQADRDMEVSLQILGPACEKLGYQKDRNRGVTAFYASAPAAGPVCIDGFESNSTARVRRRSIPPPGPIPAVTGLHTATRAHSPHTPLSESTA